MAFMRLVRFPNLIIVALTQYLVYYRLIRAAIDQNDLAPVFDHLHFFLFVFVTVCITAFGNVLNDILDSQVDLINRPDRVIPMRQVSVSTAKWVAAALAIAGFSTALYLAFYVGDPKLIWLYPAALAGLYAYNAHFKKVIFGGNFIIALFCAGAAAVLWLAERPALTELEAAFPDTALTIWSVYLWFITFAFLITLFREAVKDIEDREGDRRAGYRTVPIMKGEKFAKRLSTFYGLVLLTFIAVHGYEYRLQLGSAALLYLGIAVAAPFAAILILLQRSGSERDYRRVSQLTKMVILTGVLLLMFVNI